MATAPAHVPPSVRLPLPPRRASLAALPFPPLLALLFPLVLALVLPLLLGSGCGAARPHGIVPSEMAGGGRVVAGEGDQVWINLGRRQISAGTTLWAWPARAAPPFMAPPAAELRAVEVETDASRCRLLDGGDGASLAGGWVVVDGGGSTAPSGSWMAVPGSPAARTLVAAAGGGSSATGGNGWLPARSAWTATGGGKLPPDAISTLVYEPLVRASPYGLVPGVARSWSIDADPRCWRFRVRAAGRWSDGRPLTAATTIQALIGSLERASGSLAGSLLSGPPVLTEDGDIVLCTRRPVPDLARFLALPALGLALETNGTGPYRLLPPAAASGEGEGDGHVGGVDGGEGGGASRDTERDAGNERWTLERLTEGAGPERIEVVAGDATVNFHLARVYLWEGLRAAAPVTESRLGLHESPERESTAPRSLPAGDLWLLLAADPALHPVIAGLDRGTLIRTYFGAGEPIIDFADLLRIPGERGAGGTTARPPVAAPPAVPDTLSAPVTVLVPLSAPAPVARLGERLEALLIRAGIPARVERRRLLDEPLSSPATVTVLGISPASPDPWLQLWELVTASRWYGRQKMLELRQAIIDELESYGGRLESARRTGNEGIKLDAPPAALVARLGELGLIPLARIPVDIWLRPEVIVEGPEWRWPLLWVEPDAARCLPRNRAHAAHPTAAWRDDAAATGILDGREGAAR